MIRKKISLWLGLFIWLATFPISNIFAQEFRAKNPSLSSNSGVTGVGIKFGLGPASIYGYGNPTFDIDQLKKKLKGQGPARLYDGSITNKIGPTTGTVTIVGAYFDYAFSNYVGGTIEVNCIGQFILLQHPKYTWIQKIDRIGSVPSIELNNTGLSIPVLCSIYPFSSRYKLKVCMGISLDFPTMFSTSFTQHDGSNVNSNEIKEIDYTAAKKQLRNWDLAGIVGLGYELSSGFLSGLSVDVRGSRYFLGLLKEDYKADTLCKDSGITGIKNIKNCCFLVIVGYNVLSLFR